MSTSRRTALTLTLILGAVLIAAGTWVVALRVQSPDQREAAAAPPSAQPVTVTVARGDLAERTTVLASAQYAQTVSLPVPQPTEGRGVITRTGAQAGSTLYAGQVVTWVNSRPLIALAGAFPLYRDLYLGDQGDDVRLLQQALSDLGYGIAVDGTLGARTAAAVTALYETTGAPPPTTTTQPSAAAPAPATPTTAPAAQPTATAPTLVLPASEVLIVPTLPAVVSSAPAVGATVDEQATVAVSTSQAALTAAVPASVEARLSQGLSGTATLEGTSMDVVISEIRPPAQDTTQQDAQASTEATVVLSTTSGAVPDSWLGHTDILVTLNLSEPLLDQLLVPQRAISLDANGVATVLIAQTDGSFSQMRVTELGCVAGTCAITSEDGALREGASVRVDG